MCTFEFLFIFGRQIFILVVIKKYLGVKNIRKYPPTKI